MKFLPIGVDVFFIVFFDFGEGITDVSTIQNRWKQKEDNWIHSYRYSIQSVDYSMLFHFRTNLFELLNLQN